MSLNHLSGTLAAAICLAVLAVTHNANAADTSTLSTPGSHWQGWYLGADLGLTDASNSFDQVNTPQSPNGTITLRSYGGSVGLVGGYNAVRSNGLFYGGEADINYMTNSHQAGIPTYRSVWDGYSTLRGRIGLAVDPALLFLTGGLALVDVANEFGGNGAPNFSNDQFHVGWTIGAGAEFALTDRISLSTQYLFLQTPQDTQIDGPYKFLLDNSANIIRIGVNWHLN